MLDLASDTSDDWVQRALADLDTILLDHAHCEKKAASTAINLIFRYQDRQELMQPLSALAREELDHFEQVIAWIIARGGRFGPLTPSRYAAALHAHVRKSEPARLLDTLLVCSLIEARSCERMKRLSMAIPDPDLAAFYKGLLASEARHFHGYVEMACAAFPRDEVRARLHELAEAEAEVLRDGDAGRSGLGQPAPRDPIRMHSS